MTTSGPPTRRQNGRPGERSSGGTPVISRRSRRCAYPLITLLCVSIGACGTEPVEEREADEQDIGMEVRFDGFDLDRDARLTDVEFGAWLHRRKIFQRWNTSADSALSAPELGAGVVKLFDQDQDGNLGPAEWSAVPPAWHPGHPSAAAYAAWETNGDQALDARELGTGLVDAGLIADWDRDGSGTIEEREFVEGVFGLWDVDEDRLLTTAEWDARYLTWAII